MTKMMLVFIFLTVIFCTFLSLLLQAEETLKYRCVCRPPCGKVYYSKNRPWAHAQVRFFRFLSDITFWVNLVEKN